MDIRRSVIKLVLLAAACVFLTGCVSVSAGETGDDTAVSTEESNLRKAENAVRSFTDALGKSDMAAVMDRIYLPEDAFISESDIEWYILRSSFAELYGDPCSITDISVNGTAVEKDVKVKAGKRSYGMKLKLGTDNTWKVCVDDAYFENWALKIPGGCGVTVDGKNVSEYLKKGTPGDEKDTYLFTTIAAKEHEISISSSLYGKFTMNVTPKSSSETYTAVCRIGEAETANILNSVQYIWNSLYDAYAEGQDVPSARRYFSSDYDLNGITAVMNESFPELQKGSGKESYGNFYMSEIIPWNSNNYGAARLNTDDSVRVEFGYKIEFSDDSGNYHNCNRVTDICMVYEDGAYRILSVPDGTLFSYNDYTRNDF